MHDRIHSGDSFLRVFDANRQANTTLSTRSEEDQLSSAMSDLDSSTNFDSESSSSILKSYSGQMPKYEHFSFF